MGRLGESSANRPSANLLGCSRPASPMINLFSQTTRRTEFENSRAFVDAFIVFKDTQQYNSVVQLVIGFQTEATLNDI